MENPRTRLEHLLADLDATHGDDRAAIRDAVSALVGDDCVLATYIALEWGVAAMVQDRDHKQREQTGRTAYLPRPKPTPSTQPAPEAAAVTAAPLPAPAPNPDAKMAGVFANVAAEVAESLYTFKLPGGRVLGAARKDDLHVAIANYGGLVKGSLARRYFLKQVARGLPNDDVTVQEEIGLDDLNRWYRSAQRAGDVFLDGVDQREAVRT